MQKFKNLLDKTPVKNYEDWFREIAILLFSNYIIETNNNQYQLTEIEFYYYNQEHCDESTYGFIDQGTKYTERILKHKECQQKRLTWFFHYSGIDIVIGNESEPGGILIRAIRNLQTKENITGPLIVYLELLNQHISINDSDIFKLELIERETPAGFVMLEPRVRKGIGNNSKNFKEAKYNFSIK